MLEEEDSELKFHQRAKDLKEKFEKDIHDAKTKKNGDVYTYSMHKIEEENFVKEKYPEFSWQSRLMHVFETNKFEVFLLILLAIDIVIVLTEIFLEAHFPTCNIIDNRGYVFSCCPGTTGLEIGNTTSSGDNSSHRYLETISHHDDRHSFCFEGEIGSYAAGCDDHNDTLHLVHEILFALSVSILIIFEIELLLKAIILRTLFFKNFFLMLDVVIVSISLGLDLAFHFSSKLVAEIGSLLVTARIWRFVRVVHGVYVEMIDAQFQTQEHIDKLTTTYIKEVETLIHEYVAHDD